MKKLVLALVFSFFVGTFSFAESTDSRIVTTLMTTADTTSIRVAGTGKEYTKAFKTEHITNGEDITFFIKATSASSTPSVAYYYQESFSAPTTAANGTEDTAWLITDNLTGTQTTENWIIATAETVAGTWGRIAIFPVTTTPADTTITIKMVK